MYTNIFVDRKNFIVYLWDDERGMETIPLAKFHYAYRRKIGGDYKSLYGDELEKVTTFDERDPTLFESDLPPEMRVLLDLYPNSDEVSKNNRIVTIDIETDSSGGFPDIMKGDKAITAIAFHDKLVDKYYSYVLDVDRKISSGTDGNVETRSFICEENLLESFLNKWTEIGPSIVTGWNIIRFDLPMLYNRTRAVLGKNAGYRLSPINIAYQNKFNKQITIAGISCLDYIDLYKKFLGVMKSSYSLSNVAKDECLKTQKITYRGSLNDLYKNDIKRYAEYNLMDVRVVVDLDKKYDFIYLARSVCHKGHVPYQWFMMSSRWIDGAILCYLHSKGIIGPNKPIGGREEYEKMEKEGEDGFTGAYVKEPIPGLYDWVCSADITSLYPSIIMSLNISCETKIGKIVDWNYEQFAAGNIPLIRIGDQQVYTADDFKKMIDKYAFSIGSNGVIYHQDITGVIPKILDLWFAERVEYRKMASEYSKSGDKEKEYFYDTRQKRQKIFLNTCYGVLGLPVFRFYDRDSAEAVTLTGQAIIKGTEKIVNDYFNKPLNTPDKDHIIAVDTDSNYFSILPMAKLKNIGDDKMIDFSVNILTEISDKINRFYQRLIPTVFNVAPEKNRIKIAPDVIAKKALWVSKKHYALLKIYDMEKHKRVTDKKGNDGELKIVGLDAVRSSFPTTFRKIEREILDLLLRGTQREVLDEKIMVFEEGIDKHSIFDLAKTSSVRFISKSGEINYNPGSRRPFQFIGGSPAQVRAALAYNDFLKVWKLDKQIEKIESGSKIKWIYLLPNDFNIEALAMKADDTDPDQILDFINNNVDRRKMYERELHGKLKEIWNVVGWYYPNRGSQLASETFNFDDTW